MRNPLPTSRVFRVFGPFGLVLLLCASSLAALGFLPSAAGLAATPATLILESLPALRSGAELGAWKRTHPRDTITLYGARLAEQTNPFWCARATSEEMLAPDRTLTRTAYFYPPPRPEPPVLPANTSGLLDRCVLGFVWVQEKDSNDARAQTTTAETRGTIRAALGAEDAAARPRWWGGANWRQTAMWFVEGASLASAVTTSTAWADQSASATRVLALAAAPRSGIDLQRMTLRDHDPSLAGVIERREASRFDRALALAAQADDLASEMRRFKARFDVRPDAPRFSADETRAFLDALDRWMAAAATRPANSRAASLLAADQLLEQSESSVGWAAPGQTATLRRLQAHGAQFVYNGIARAYAYTRTWLKQALQIDPDGPAGEQAFVTLMELGFGWGQPCDSRRQPGLREPITRGEAYLRAHPNSPIAGDIRFLMARAHADIVALAAGAAYDDAESASYQQQAALARTRAIAQYRLAFDLDGTSDRARESWTDAWRLLAGVAPTRTYFYCMGD